MLITEKRIKRTSKANGQRVSSIEEIGSNALSVFEKNKSTIEGCPTVHGPFSPDNTDSVFFFLKDEDGVFILKMKQEQKFFFYC